MSIAVMSALTPIARIATLNVTRTPGVVLVGARVAVAQYVLDWDENPNVSHMPNKNCTTSMLNLCNGNVDEAAMGWRCKDI